MTNEKPKKGEWTPERRAAQAERMRNSHRTTGWWRESCHARILLSGRLISEIAELLSISQSRAASLRNKLFDENFGIAGFKEEKISETPSERMSKMRRDPYYRERQRFAMKKKENDQRFRADRIKRMQKFNADLHVKQKLSMLGKRLQEERRLALKAAELAARDGYDPNWSEDPRTLAVCLKAWQIGHGLSATEAAKLLNLSTSSFWRYLAGKNTMNEQAMRDLMRNIDEQIGRPMPAP